MFGISTVSLYGFVLIIAGLALRLQINRRRFNRRSPAGLQQYPNYWIALFTTFMESIVSIVGYLMIIIGLILLLIQWYNQH